MPNFSADYINDSLLSCKGDFIAECENAYRRKLDNITKEICREKGRTVVMLAGPSSSGKTTTARILQNEIRENSRHACMISLDDFYRDQEESFYFEDGTVDYETVKALDTGLIAKCLNELLNEGESDIPHFSFHTKRREGYERVKVSDDEIIIVEGLHALNPEITDPLEGQSLKKLYVSVSSRVYDGDKILLTKRDMRFVRRLIRDYHFRSSAVDYTFYLWKGVRMGEDRYLFPFSDRADIKIDSIHPYEPCIFKDIAIKLLDHIDEKSVYYPSACELKNKLQKFVSLKEDDVPQNSLLREFIG